MASSIDASIPICPLYISGVDSSNSKKNVYSAQLWISLKSRMPIKNRAGKALRQTFSPSMIRCLGDTFSLPVRYKRCQYGTEHENIVFELEDMVCVCGTRERRGAEYNKVHKNITIVVELPRCPTTKWAEQLVSSSDETLELQPTTDEICRKCSQFRILGIGKTGIGKSSPINHTFGVQNATASHDKPGEASVDHESISPQNDRFVLHDSKGFEPAEKDNLDVVRDFIDRRRAMPDLKGQLQALGFDVPCAGGDLETNVKQFITSKREGELVTVPLLSFSLNTTPYMERTLDKSSLKGLSKKATDELTKKSEKESLHRTLQKFARLDVLHVTFSTNGNQEETLARSIQTTEELVCKHVGTDLPE